MSHQYPTGGNSLRPLPSRRKWFIDFQMRKQDRLLNNHLIENHPTSSTGHAHLSLNPIGFSEQRVSDIITQEDDERLLAKRSWDIALQPIKQLPMNVILAWMAGNSFSLMSIMIVLMLFMKPIQVEDSFHKIDIVNVRIVFLSIQGYIRIELSICSIRTRRSRRKHMVS
jgi:hypothetical protein